MTAGFSVRSLLSRLSVPIVVRPVRSTSSDGTDVQDEGRTPHPAVLAGTSSPSPSGAAVVVSNLAPQFRQSEMVIAGEMPSVDLPLIWGDEWPRIHYVLGQWPEGRRGRHLRRRLLIAVNRRPMCFFDPTPSLR